MTSVLLEEDFTVVDTLVRNDDWDLRNGELETDGNDDGRITFKPVDMTNATDASLSIDMRAFGATFEGSGRFRDTFSIELVDADGNVVLVLDHFQGGNNQSMVSTTGSGNVIDPHMSTFTYDIPDNIGVVSLSIKSNISASNENIRIDNVVIAADIGDGVVNGTESGEVMAVGFTDAQGDMITDGDDVIDGAGGDDTILGGAGDDSILGGAGNDLIEGGAGNDTLLGDNADGTAGPSVSRESFNWQKLTSDAQIDHGVDQDTGSITVSYDRTADLGHHISDGDNHTHLNVDGLDAGTDSNSALNSTTNGSNGVGAFEWVFSQAVTNVQFNINDIDGDGIVRVFAFDADGNQVDVTLTAGSKITLLDSDGIAGVDTADSQGGYAGTTSAEYNLNVSIADEEVARLVVEHSQDGHANSGIWITDINFDVLTFSENNDTLSGGEGDDFLSGGIGDDFLSGGAGDDELDGGEGDDVLDGGAGNDTFHAGNGNDQVSGGEGDDVLSGGGGEDSLDGGAGNDVMNGGVDADLLTGGSGDDTINGGGGDGADLIDGGDGDDSILAGRGDDTIDGGNGNDSINASDGNDIIFGGAGDDTIIAAPGSDTITGGDGADTFRFTGNTTLGETIITDFTLGEDNVLLNGVRIADLAASDVAGGLLVEDTTDGSTILFLGLSTADFDTIF